MADQIAGRHGGLIVPPDWLMLWLGRGPADTADAPVAGVTCEDHQLRDDVLLGVALVVLRARDDPGGITPVERHAQRATHGFDLLLEFDVRREVVRLVFSARLDFR